MTRKKYTYKMRSYINASHAIRWEAGIGSEHPHTWEIICEIVSSNDHMIKFEDIEEVITETISDLSGKFLNTIAPFDKINPTLENLTNYLFDMITDSLKKINCKLIRIEVGESPTRFYCISLD
ncbi:6-pyruvoyl tetrahydropterin synthase [Oenococcus oeni]|uniref:6-carboxytetrahydropterin synthase n=1 Tax=Oenococcus oeni TaxID=1247 RepID=UPI0008F82DDD|nr:6-carboxytetrahydropterin synthase [Oenococcus oeni]OIK98249.1 6-pyruvoyl tetrahydropterin synthase [Oenococcus oeni]PDH95620.1 6-pyruvoyl tetrahydropterin synthase [Oenococcus oeni]